MSIIVNHVSYVYNPGTVYEKRALNDVSLQIQDGEYIGLVGHTGCGKSTLVQHLNGLLKATEGGIYYDGQDIYDKDFSMTQLRGNVGLVFQYPEHQLFEEDVFTDVCFGPKNLGLSKAEAELRAYDALKLVGIKDEQFYVSPFDLSGGEKRRVAIAGVLAMQPKVLVLDEPTAGLDPKRRDELLDMIDELRTKRSITIILVSHSMDDMAERVERLVVINNGSVLLDGPTREVFSQRTLLDGIGLETPVVTTVLSDLAAKGYPLRRDGITVGEAADEIMRLYNARGMR